MQRYAERFQQVCHLFHKLVSSGTGVAVGVDLDDGVFTERGRMQKWTEMGRMQRLRSCF